MIDELVSVIIPTYNRAGTLRNTMNSVLNQSYTNLELIIVDDASTDETEGLVLSIDDARVRYIRLNTNSGPSVARNTGIKAATGDYIAFQDSDDIWLEDKIERQLEAIHKDNTLGLVYTGYSLIYDDDRIVYIPPVSMDMKLKEGYIYKSLLMGNKIGTPTMLIKRNVLEELGGFDIQLKAYEDWDLSIRISKHYKIGFVNAFLVKAYSHIGGVNSNLRNIIDALCYMAVKYRDDCIKYSLMSEKISKIIEECISFNPAYIDTIKSILIPKVIETEAFFDILYYQAIRTYKFKDNYNTLVKMIETESLLIMFNKICIENKWESVGIYGAGNIGRLLLRNLESGQVNVKYLIDKKNDSNMAGKIRIISPEEIGSDIDVIIVTIPSEYENIVKQIRKHTNCDIISIKQLLK